MIRREILHYIITEKTGTIDDFLRDTESDIEKYELLDYINVFPRIGIWLATPLAEMEYKVLYAKPSIIERLTGYFLGWLVRI